MIEAVLFDLDGTLIDTAKDMGTALNNLLTEENLPRLRQETIRPYVSQGGLVLTKLGFDEHVHENGIESLRQRYLLHYHDIIADQSRLFDDFGKVLNYFDDHKIRWGIVTNKPEWLTRPLLSLLAIQSPVVILRGYPLNTGNRTRYRSRWQPRGCRSAVKTVSTLAMTNAILLPVELLV